MPSCSCGFDSSDETLVRCPGCRALFGDIIPPEPDHRVGAHDPLVDKFNEPAVVEPVGGPIVVNSGPIALTIDVASSEEPPADELLCVLCEQPVDLESAGLGLPIHKECAVKRLLELGGS